MADNKVKFLRGTSDEYAAAVKDNDAIYFTTDDGKIYIGDKKISGDGSVTVDNTLSDTSTNPVQNKVVKQAIDNKADKTIATTDTNGLMSAEDKTKLDNVDDTYALKSKYGNTTIDVGRKAETDVGEYSTAEGQDTTASGYAAQAEGDRTKAIGGYTHAEGVSTTADRYCSHAEGEGTKASGVGSHAEGWFTTASGDYSYAGGCYTKALRTSEFAHGKYNKSHINTLFSIGDGTADDARHNAFEITTDGGKLHDKDIATTDLIPTSVPASGGNADTVNNHTVDSDVPANAVFTDTVYDDTDIRAEIANKADITSIPSKVSELENDSGFKTTDNDTLPYQYNTTTDGEYRLLLSYQANDNSYREDYLRKSGKFTANPSTGTLKANSVIVSESTDYTTPKCRNCTMSTSSASGGSNGDIHFQYS